MMRRVKLGDGGSAEAIENAFRNPLQVYTHNRINRFGWLTPNEQTDCLRAVSVTNSAMQSSQSFWIFEIPDLMKGTRHTSERRHQEGNGETKELTLNSNSITAIR